LRQLSGTPSVTQGIAMVGARLLEVI